MYKLEQFHDFRERTVRTQVLLIDMCKKINTNQLQNEKIACSPNVNLIEPNFGVHQQQLLAEHNYHTHIDVDLEHRTSIVVKDEEMTLEQHGVDVDPLSLDHSSEAPETLSLVRSTIHNVHYTEPEITVLHQPNQHEQYGLQYEPNMMMESGVLPDSLDPLRLDHHDVPNLDIKVQEALSDVPSTIRSAHYNKTGITVLHQHNKHMVHEQCRLHEEPNVITKSSSDSKTARSDVETKV